MARQLDVDFARINEQSKMGFKNELLKIIACSDNKKEIAMALVNFIAKEASDSTELYSIPVLERADDFLGVLKAVSFR